MDQTPKLDKNTTTHDLSDSIAKNSIIHAKVKTEYIVISDDRLTNILERHKTRRVDWIAPFGIFITLLCTMIFSDPKTMYGVKASDIHALFFTTTVLSFIWFIWMVWRAIRYRGNNTPQAILKDIKNIADAPLE